MEIDKKLLTAIIAILIFISPPVAILRSMAVLSAYNALNSKIPLWRITDFKIKFPAVFRQPKAIGIRSSVHLTIMRVLENSPETKIYLSP